MQQNTFSDELTAEEAANYLGVDLKALAPLLERYGVGRHYEARPGDEFVYDRTELDKIKRDLAARATGSPP